MKDLNKKAADALAAETAKASILFRPVYTSPGHAPDLLRAEVPGGWLLAVKHKPAAGVTFVPDARHTWLTPARTKRTKRAK